jgi:hypothetical protein
MARFMRAIPRQGRHLMPDIEIADAPLALEMTRTKRTLTVGARYGSTPERLLVLQKNFYHR